MEAKTLFNKIAESRLLKTLLKRGNIAFIGDEDTIRYLNKFFEQNNKPCNYDYYSWEENSSNSFPALNTLLKNQYDAIIIASINNEHIIWDNFKQYLNNLSIEIPTLKLFSDIFVNLKLNQPLLQPSSCEIIFPKVAYAIVSTPRAGSTVLCEALSSTKIAGFPKEDLRESSAILTQHCRFDSARLLQMLMTYKTTQNGVFGTKLIFQFLSVFSQSEDFEQILKQFKLIYLTRRDKIAQAVSLFLAQKTKIWHIYSSQQNKKYQSQLKQVNIEDSDLEILHSIYQRILNQEHFLESFFERCQLVPLIIEYEKFIEQPEKHLNTIVNYLNIVDKNQQIRILNRYQYRLYQVMKALKIKGEDEKIRIKFTTRQLQSNTSRQIISRYQEKYS
ncbi:MAG: Stf0 family sulfotransferase [Microcystaceae cyanobacterium]